MITYPNRGPGIVINSDPQHHQYQYQPQHQHQHQQPLHAYDQQLHEQQQMFIEEQQYAAAVAAVASREEEEELLRMGLEQKLQQQQPTQEFIRINIGNDHNTSGYDLGVTSGSGGNVAAMSHHGFNHNMASGSTLDLSPPTLALGNGTFESHSYNVNQHQPQQMEHHQLHHQHQHQHYPPQEQLMLQTPQPQAQQQYQLEQLGALKRPDGHDDQDKSHGPSSCSPS